MLATSGLLQPGVGVHPGVQLQAVSGRTLFLKAWLAGIVVGWVYRAGIFTVALSLELARQWWLGNL